MGVKHKFPIPEGFSYSHVAGTYQDKDYRTWDDETNVIRDRDGNVVSPQSVASTSDQRVANNVMRHEYRVLSEDEKAKMKVIKDAGVAFTELCDSLGTSRELSLAKTNMEQAVMWAVKHLTK